MTTAAHSLLFLFFNYAALSCHFLIPFNYALLQHPHLLQVDHSFHVLPPQPNTFLAQPRFVLRSQGALPPLHEAQFMSLICQRPTS
jgi:hypothetical protein